MNGVLRPPSTHAGGRLEDDDVAPRVVVEARRQLVDEDVLVGLERALHRLLLDPVGLGDERLDDEEDDEGEDERLDDLEEAPEGASCHKTGSIGAPAPARASHAPAGAAGAPRACASVHNRRGMRGLTRPPAG